VGRNRTPSGSFHKPAPSLSLYDKIEPLVDYILSINSNWRIRAKKRLHELGGVGRAAWFEAPSDIP
jgi:hypothetical protein